MSFINSMCLFLCLQLFRIYFKMDLEIRTRRTGPWLEAFRKWAEGVERGQKAREGTTMTMVVRRNHS